MMDSPSGPIVNNWPDYAWLRGERVRIIQAMQQPYLLFPILILSAITLVFSACQKEEKPTNPIEAMGESMEKAGKELQEATKDDSTFDQMEKDLKKTGKELEKDLKKAAESMEKNLKKAGEEMEKTAEELQKNMEEASEN